MGSWPFPETACVAVLGGLMPSSPLLRKTQSSALMKVEEDDLSDSAYSVAASPSVAMPLSCSVLAWSAEQVLPGVSTPAADNGMA